MNLHEVCNAVVTAIADDLNRPGGWASSAIIPDEQPNIADGYVKIDGGEIRVTRIASVVSAAIIEAQEREMTGQADPLALLEKTAEVADAYTGVKRQLIDRGWSEAAAEQIVLANLATPRAS